MIGTLTMTRLAALPRSWFVPQAERIALALIGAVFWTSTIWQALHVAAHGASVFSLFGLGFIYTAFSTVNVWTATVRAMGQYTRGRIAESQPRSLAQLFIILSGMLVCNALVLGIYLAKGASFTQLDCISVIIDAIILAVLIFLFGVRGLVQHPLARGWIAVAGKTVPQAITAVLFVLHPAAAHGLTVVTLLGIDVLAALRFTPTLRAFMRDRRSHHLRGLLIGEGGNTISGILLSVAWMSAMLR